MRGIEFVTSVLGLDSVLALSSMLKTWAGAGGDILPGSSFLQEDANQAMMDEANSI